jgi:hypothetical protein
MLALLLGAAACYESPWGSGSGGDDDGGDDDGAGDDDDAAGDDDDDAADDDASGGDDDGTPTPPEQFAPIAVIEHAGGPVDAPVFDGAGSYDPDDSSASAISFYDWDLIQQPAGSGANLQEAGGPNLVSLPVDVPGTYVVQLLVLDQDGLSSEPATYPYAAVSVEIDGDCVTAECPADNPYPVGCDIVMEGGDERGCVASTPENSVVYFQEGDACGAGHVEGTLGCAARPGDPLDAESCPINKPVTYYPATPDGCPETSG